MKRVTSILIVAAFCIVAAQNAWSSLVTRIDLDLNPPDWREQFSTTSQVWDFLDPIQPYTPIDPDGAAPGGASPIGDTHAVYDPLDGGRAWMEEYQPVEYQSGVWVGIGVLPLSGEIFVHVNNHEPPNDVKYVWLQLIWNSCGGEPIFSRFDPEPVAQPELVDEVDLGGNWIHSTYGWELRPNPCWEDFVIGGPIYVDQMTIDTWCIPEPSTIGILALGSIGVLLRLRRRS